MMSGDAKSDLLHPQGKIPMTFRQWSFNNLPVKSGEC